MKRKRYERGQSNVISLSAVGVFTETRRARRSVADASSVNSASMALNRKDAAV
jgi:hypothetical protein